MANDNIIIKELNCTLEERTSSQGKRFTAVVVELAKVNGKSIEKLVFLSPSEAALVELS